MNRNAFSDIFGPARLALSPELAATFASLNDCHYKTWALDMAIIVQQLDFWLKGTSGETDSEGRRWIHNSLQTWQQQFPWMSVWGVRQALDKLRELGIVLFEKRKKHHWWHRGWYSLDYKALQRLKPLPELICESPHIHESDSPPIDVCDRHTSDHKISSQKNLPTKEGARSLEEEDPEEGQEELLAKPDIEPESPALQQTVTAESNVPRVGRDLQTNLTEKLKNRLAECQIPLDKKVVDAIEKHHISQVYGALAHIENTWETIDNPRAVFLFQLPKQPIETLGCRQPLYSAANAPGMDVEASEPPPGFFDALRRKLGRK